MPIIIDIEVAPLKLETYFSLDDAEKLKLLNPIDSKIIAIGIKINNEEIQTIFGDEIDIISQFWNIIEMHKTEQIVGFNVKQFDMPFITSRSFINNIKISPFSIKNILDIREQINAFRYGQTRGKLKEYAVMVGIDILDVDGSDIARLYANKDFEIIKEYLEKDIKITYELFKRMENTNISKITRY